MVKARTFWLGLFLAVGWVALSGCELAYFVAGNGAQRAAVTIPRHDRVVVLVDASAAGELSISAVSSVITAVNQQLYAFRVSQRLVPAYQIIGLQRRDAMHYQEMSIGQIVRALHADVAVYLFVDRFEVQTLSTGQVTRGQAQVLVKVVDRAGRRLWPVGVRMGAPISADVPANYALTQTPGVVEHRLISQLARRIGRLFYAHAQRHQHGARAP